MLLHLAIMIASVQPGQTLRRLVSEADPETRRIMQMVRTKQLYRWRDVKNYSMVSSMTSISAPPLPHYFVKDTVDGRVTFLEIPMQTWTGADSEQAREMARGMSLGYRLLARGQRSGQMQQLPGPMGAMFDNMIAGMLDSAAMMLDSIAAAPKASDGRAEARAGMSGVALFAGRARLVGIDTVANRTAFHLRATGLGDIEIEQADSAPPFRLDAASMWIDTVEYVTLRVLAEGRMTAEDGRILPVTIEALEYEYKQVGPLYEATRQRFRLTGLMEAMATDPRRKKEMEKMRKDMEKARTDMAKLDSQMAKMPASQRAMIEPQMRKYKQQMDMMLNDGAMVTEFTRRIHGINKGPPVDVMPLQQ